MYEPTGPTYVMTVAAVVRPCDDIAVDESRTTSTRFTGNEMLLSYDFWERHHHEFLDFGQAYYLKLADGAAGVQAVVAALPSLVAPDALLPQTFPDSRFRRRASFATPVDLETTALMALGIGLALASAATLFLMLRTEQRFHDRDVGGLRALGLGPLHLGTIAAVRTFPVGIVGGGVAMVGSVALVKPIPDWNRS